MSLILHVPPELRSAPSVPSSAMVVPVEADVPLRSGPAPNTVVASMPEYQLSRTRGLVPLFLLVPDGDEWWAYTQLLYSTSGIVFCRLDGPPLRGIPNEGTLRVWLSVLVALRRKYASRLNNHQRWFVKHRASEEIEHKFTLPPDREIWNLSVDMLHMLREEPWDGWIFEHRNDFEQWDFDNYLFEIAEPEPDRGYVSFIPAVDGSWIIKRKWFGEDTPIRREQRWRGVELPDRPSFEDEIRRRFDVSPAWGASFRRERCDINLESLSTGHGYSVMFDRCTVPGLPSAVLVQCEVEYLRSRTLLPIEDAALISEFQWLVSVTRDWLASRRIDAVEDHFSKLSFLRRATGNSA